MDKLLELKSYQVQFGALYKGNTWDVKNNTGKREKRKKQKQS